MFENNKPTWLGVVWYICNNANIPDCTNLVRFILVVLAGGNMIWLVIYIVWAWISNKEIAKLKNERMIKDE